MFLSYPFQKKMDQLIAPISQQIKELSQSLQEVSRTSDTTLELGLTNQEDAKIMQKIVIMDDGVRNLEEKEN